MKIFKAALVAGAAGGTAEMLWVAGYSGAGGVEVAREVAATLYVTDLMFAPLAGVAIHMALSIALGLALAKLLLGWAMPRFGSRALLPAALAALACVWALNFFVVLPVLNPAFVTLLPLAVTLVSKLLFGAALAATLQWKEAECTSTS